MSFLLLASYLSLPVLYFLRFCPKNLPLLSLYPASFYPVSLHSLPSPVLLPQHRSSLQAFQTALLQDMQNWTATLPEAVPQDPVHRSALSRTLSSSMHHLHCLPASLNHQDLSLKNQSSNSDLLDSESLNSHTSRYM